VSATELATVLAALGFGGAFVAVVNAVSQRRKVGADATSVVTAAARELVDPLRRELANERAEHAREVEAERMKVAQVRAELDAALREAKDLRNELAMARVEADALRRDREEYRAKNRDQQAQIVDLQAKLRARNR
jgi:protein tyrosine/serine phosphatase